VRLRERDVDDRRQPFVEVFPLRLDVVLVEALLFRVRVDRSRQRLAEAGQVRAAVRVVLVVGVTADAFLVAGRVLERDLDLDLIDVACRSLVDGPQ
jgi:hypothetical protein